MPLRIDTAVALILGATTTSDQRGNQQSALAAATAQYKAFVRLLQTKCILTAASSMLSTLAIANLREAVSTVLT